MKRLWIIRHAKSAHGPQYNSDFERPLNKRGKRDAPLMARELKKATKNLDKLLVSAAERTRETASYFIKEYNIHNRLVDYDDTLYLPDEQDIWTVVSRVDNDLDAIAVFTHNPAVENLLHHFRPGTTAPTCSIIELHYDGDNWGDIGPGDVRFISHKYPKLYV